MDTTTISDSNEAARSLIEQFLHPRMTSEHVNSGGGSACRHASDHFFRGDALLDGR